MKFFAVLFFFLFVQQSHAFVPDEAYTFDFNIRTIGMGKSRERKIDHSVDILREIFSSAEFKRRILNHRYRGRYQFWKNKGLSNAQIYRKILAGAEKLYPYLNNAMDVELALYTDNESEVIGFTNPGTKRIWMNTKYFNNRSSPAKVASHLTHEWLHKLGFDHEKEKCEERKYSVPYAIGYIVRDLALKKFFNKRKNI